MGTDITKHLVRVSPLRVFLEQNFLFFSLALIAHSRIIQTKRSIKYFIYACPEYAIARHTELHLHRRKSQA